MIIHSALWVSALVWPEHCLSAVLVPLMESHVRLWVMLIFILPYMGRRFLLEFKFRYFPNGRFAKFKFNSVKLTNLGHVAKLNPVYIFNHLNLMGEVYFYIFIATLYFILSQSKTYMFYIWTIFKFDQYLFAKIQVGPKCGPRFRLEKIWFSPMIMASFGIWPG